MKANLTCPILRLNQILKFHNSKIKNTKKFVCKAFLKLRKIIVEPVLMIPLGLLFEQSLAEGKITGNFPFMRPPLLDVSQCR